VEYSGGGQRAKNSRRTGACPRPLRWIYFAHPYHSWERGLNGHTNGLIRQYLPKKIPFNTLTPKELDKIVEKINNRRRKVLGCLTPYEVFSP
jgi:IS30 family transposase